MQHISWWCHIYSVCQLSLWIEKVWEKEGELQKMDISRMKRAF